MKEYCIEYKMPKEMARIILKARKGTDAKMKPNDFLCKYVNEQYGLLGTCTNVILF